MANWSWNRYEVVRTSDGKQVYYSRSRGDEGHNECYEWMLRHTNEHQRKNYGVRKIQND